MSRNLPGRVSQSIRGNVTVMFSLILPTLIFAIGMGVDYSRAVSVRARLNAAADAAVLAALTPAMLQQTASAAQSAASSMFNSQVRGIGSLTPDNTTVSVSVTNPGGNALVRQVKLTYSAQSANIFAGILGVASISLTGASVAKASIPPNIDFYLLLDNSPSMSLPATSDGISLMQTLTRSQYGGSGCAFACHQASTNNGDTIGNPCADGTMPGSSGYCSVSTHGAQIDNFQLAHNNNIKLRLDELTTGVSTLMTLAANTAASGQFATPPNYRFAVYSMDTLWNLGTGANLVMPLTASYVSQWATNSAGFGVMEMYANSVGCANAACSSGVGFNDIATNYDVALNSINQIMPTPGAGSNVTGDKPEEVLFFVTDGVEDENNPGRLIQAINANNAHNYCTDIKNRGVKIAILYTEYLPVPANSFYNSYVAPIQTTLGPALQACASPGLFYDAVIGADLGKALTTLFQAVVQSATLTN